MIRARTVQQARIGRQPRGWWRLIATAIMVAAALYALWQEQQRTDPVPGPVATTADEVRPSAPPVKTRGEQENPGQVVAPQAGTAITATANRTTIASQTIRSEDGKVVFRGEIDVGPTLSRIERGERLSFSHDGTTFQNRERRLPRQAAGYYKEFVHPTPGLRGPGPQRIVTGQRGEIYYTPDHYGTFQRLDEP